MTTLWRGFVMIVLTIITFGVASQNVKETGDPTQYWLIPVIWVILGFYYYRKDKKAEAKEREKRIQEQVEAARRIRDGAWR